MIWAYRQRLLADAIALVVSSNEPACRSKFCDFDRGVACVSPKRILATACMMVIVCLDKGALPAALLPMKGLQRSVFNPHYIQLPICNALCSLGFSDRLAAMSCSGIYTGARGVHVTILDCCSVAGHTQKSPLPFEYL